MGSNKSGDASEREFQERLRDFAHEIHTPLNALIGYSQLIKRELNGDQDDAKLKDYNHTVEESTVRLLRICERILDDAISGEFAVKITNVDMGELSLGILSTFSELAKDKGISLNSDFPDNFPDLSTDRVLVEQVLTNLVSNAIKFTPAGGSISLKGEINAENNAMIFLIRDTGKGIPADLLLKIRNGERVTTSPKLGQKGWGRGLSIAQQICARLDASLRFEPAENGGTVVMFTLPLAPSPTPDR
jgi:two-component system, cell cycle sensor histidine kinase PleC